jgi:hypothetical protein
MSIKVTKYGIWAGLLLGTVLTSSATTLVTFQVDLSNAGIDPNTETMSARGSFNGWGAFDLTNNPSGATPYVYSGTTTVDTNGIVMEYKFVGSTLSWENIPKGHNRLVTLPTTSGASLVLPVVYYGDNTPSPITVDVTFQVDMAQQTNVGAFDVSSSLIYPKGTWNGWGTPDAMTNDPTILRTNQYGLVTSNVYVFTYSVTGSPGQTMDFKYFIDLNSNYESPAPGTGDPSDNNNRFFNLSDGTPQTLPIVYFSDAPFAPVATNDITFQVDMTSQVVVGNFDPTTGTVQVRGDFTSWETAAVTCTNDPAATNTNLYSAVIPIVDGIGSTRFYKFWASVPANSGWENLDNRTLQIISGTSQTLPVVLFGNIYNDPADYLPEDTTVTFSVNMTNAVGTDSHVFDPVFDSVYLNGVPNGFVTWDTSLPWLNANPVGSLIYTVELLLPKGSPVRQTYKYGINGLDNEAGIGTDRVRYIRKTGTYILPLDTFGSIVIEPSFEQTLAIGPVVGGQVPVSWLGRPGVHLQTKSDLASGAWQDLPATDGATWSSGYDSTNGFVSVTNCPTSAGQTFFRLIKP